MKRSSVWWCSGLLLLAIALPFGAAPHAAGKPDPKASVLTPAPRREGHPRIYLSWNAPWGLPRAREAVSSACDDTTAADTLYLTFDPGEDVNELMGIDAALTFHAAPKDSLGPFWDLSRKGVNPWNLRIEFDEPPDGADSPWPVSGMGSPRYILARDSGRLDLTYFIDGSKAGPIAAGTRYFFARVMLRLRKPYLGGCKQPVCVSFDHLKVSYSGGGRWINEGERFATWNSADGAACKECRQHPLDPEPLPFGQQRSIPPIPPDSTGH